MDGTVGDPAAGVLLRSGGHHRRPARPDPKNPALESAFTAETGVPLDNPEILLTPVVRLQGTIDGAPLGSVLTPSLSFRVDGSLLDVIGTSAGGGTPSTPAMAVVRSGSVAQRTLVPARLSLAGRSLAVSRARRLGLAGLALSVLAVIGGFIWWTRRRRMDETARIHATYGPTTWWPCRPAQPPRRPWCWRWPPSRSWLAWPDVTTA